MVVNDFRIKPFLKLMTPILCLINIFKHWWKLNLLGCVHCLWYLSYTLFQPEFGSLKRRLIHRHMLEIAWVWWTQLLETPKEVLLRCKNWYCFPDFRGARELKVSQFVDPIMYLLMSALKLVSFVVYREWLSVYIFHLWYFAFMSLKRFGKVRLIILMLSSSIYDFVQLITNTTLDRIIMILNLRLRSYIWIDSVSFRNGGASSALRPSPWRY